MPNQKTRTNLTMKKTLLRPIASLFLLVLMTDLTSAWAAPLPVGSLTRDDVLSTKGGRYYLDHKQFAEISFNKFDLFWELHDELVHGKALNDANPMVKAQEKALRDLREMGFRSIRIFALPWGPAGPACYADPARRKTFYAALDKTLELCDRYDIRVVWSLGAVTFTEAVCAEGKEPVPGQEHTRELVADPESRSRKLLYRYIDETVARYKNRKAVMMWEISNEVTLLADIGDAQRIYNGERMPTLKQVAGFFDDVAKRIKAVDPLRLVCSGGSNMRGCQWNLYQNLGWRPDTLGEQYKCYEMLYKNSAVDVVDIHCYPNNKPGQVIRRADGKETLLLNKDYMWIAEGIGKPLMIGELGLAAIPKTDKTIWGETPDYFESFADTKAARPWVEKTLNAVVEAGIPLTYWWSYQSDRPMDQGQPQRYDIDKDRNPELIACFVQANKMLKRKLGIFETTPATGIRR